jgi:hypothetical protein
LHIDQAVLAAQKAGNDWQTVRGIHSHRQFMRVLGRARWALYPDTDYSYVESVAWVRLYP